MRLVVGEAANGEHVRLAVGEALLLELPENPTTGYRWKLEMPGGPVLALTSEDRHAPEASQGASAPAGAAGTHSWTFHAVGAGRAALRLAYRRSFSSATDASRDYHLDVEVHGS